MAQRSDVSVTLLVTRQDLGAIWSPPNTIGWDIAHDGIRLRVDCAEREAGRSNPSW